MEYRTRYASWSKVLSVTTPLCIWLQNMFSAWNTCKSLIVCEGTREMDEVDKFLRGVEIFALKMGALGVDLIDEQCKTRA